MTLSSQSPIGRFAPSPTGHLHFGSLISAVASYCHVKKQQGKWLVRLEDTDTQRCKQVYSGSILRTLALFGLESDAEVIYQHNRNVHYQDAIDNLLQQNSAYFCTCSRKSIQAYISNHHLVDSHRYPNICRDNEEVSTGHVRLRTPNVQITFADSFQGKQHINPFTCTGDMVLKRKEGIVNYILTSIVDDIAQGVTEVIRGLDLIELTPCQLVIAQSLGDNTQRNYGHLPLALNAQGQKLSKQNKAVAFTQANLNEKQIAQTLSAILNALLQPKVEIDTPTNMLAQAVAQWDSAVLVGKQKVAGCYE